MKRSELWTVIGVVASLIGIITFLTGKQSIHEFLADSPPSTQPEGSVQQSPPVLDPATNKLRSITPMPSRRAVTDPKEVILHTTAGIIKLRLLADRSPEHVARFAALAGEGFYDAVQFRRVVPGVLVEANYRSDNPLGSYQRPELSDFSFRRGLVGMSTSGNPLREGWQFFILTGDAPYLNGMYTPLAEVQEGMEVVDRIAQAGSSGRWQWILSVDVR